MTYVAPSSGYSYAAPQFRSTLTNGVNSFGIPQAPAQPRQQSSGGGSIFGWHPHIPNLGGITALKQFGSGILGLIEAPVNILQGKETLGEFAGGMAKGIGGGVAGVAETAGRIVGIPGTNISLEGPIKSAVAPLFGGEAPPDFFELSKREGPIAAFANQALAVAAVAAPIAGSLAGSAGAAAEASTTAGALADAAEAAGGAEAATLRAAADAQAARAASLAQQAEVAHNFAHPFGYLMRQGSGLLSAAAEQVRPPVSESAGAVAAPHEIAMQEAIDTTRATLDPMAGAGAAVSRSALEDAVQAAVREAQSLQGPSNADMLNQFPGAPTKTLYRGEPAMHENAARGTQFHENPRYAQNFAGEGGNVYKVEVPVDETGKPLVGEPAQVPDVGHVLPGDWADTAQKVEPAGPKAAKPYGTPEEAAKISEAVKEAQPVGRESSVAEATAKRLQLPPPNWARQLTSYMPSSVNRVLSFVNTPIDRYRVRAVARDYTRLAEVSQRAARNSPAMAASRQAAVDILNAAREAGIKLTRNDVSHMVGEEIGARLDGTALVEAAIKDTAGNASEAIQRALRDTARRGYKGISDEVMNALTPEMREALNQHLDEAVAAWREHSRATLDTLLASSHGAHGLEQAVLEDTTPTMTPAQVKLYRKAMLDLRRAQQWRDRVPDQISSLQAAAERQSLVSDKAAAEAATARRLIGVSMATAESLRVGVPRGIERLGESLDAIKAGIAEGGVTYDVGLGKATQASEGFAVGIAPQFDVPLQEFLANGDELIRNALLDPQSIDGESYGTAIWAGPDARFGAWVYTGADGLQRVAGDVSMSTWGGRPLEQWQATILGETFHQDAIFDAATGNDVYMTKQPDTQNLMAHYATDALNPQSSLSRFARQLVKATGEVSRIGGDEIDAQLRFFATWDYALSRTNPDTWHIGDYFDKVNVDFGKGQPTLPALMQTVLNIGSSADGVNESLAHLSARQVSDALAWYYDSHDYIESSYRGKTMTLLDGSQRDAADVFYDLIAVTSQMASPKQNLGRALMGFANVDDFVKARRGAMDAGQKLLARLEKLPEKARYDDKVVQQIIDRTGMVGNTKRLAFDVLSGRLNLETATEAEIGRQPEFWGSPGKALSTKNVPEGVSPMEYHGSGALAKMRSFRDNLANPAESTAVTLDSVMSRMYGFRGTDWSLKGKYASYADDIRSAAEMLSQKLGRDVRPHEVQALLWVYTKSEVGRMDWGRLLAHHDWAHQQLDAMEATLAQGGEIDARSFDPLNDYFDEELGYSRTRLEQQMRFSMLQKQVRKYGIESLHPNDVATYEAGVSQAPVRTTVEVAPDRADVSAVPQGQSGVFQDRWAIPYDAKTLTVQEERYRNYLAVRDNIQDALEEGNIAEARHQLTSYVVGQRRSIQGDVGGSFQQVGEETRSSPIDSAHIAEQRLQKAKRVPAPRQWASNFISPLAARFNRENGLTPPTAIDTEAQVVPARTAEVAQAVKQLAERERNGQLTDAERAASERSYRVLQEWIDKQYAFMTEQLGLKVDYVRPDQEYGIGSLGDDPQPRADFGHSLLVHDVRANNHLAVRGTALAGDGPNRFMAETAPDGLLYNDKLRAVHDFYGHAQAANDFSRHGENVAQMLHLQMFPEEAWPALFTEFRSQTAYLVDQGHFLDDQLTALLPEHMQAPDYMLRSSGDELHQRYMDTVRGATIMPAEESGRLTMRLYHNAAIDTLAHEGAHALRQMLPPEAMAWVEEHYPHITDATLTGARVAAEEKFVEDMMLHIRDQVRGAADPATLPDAFRKIAGTMEEQVAGWQDTVAGRGGTPEVAEFWNRMFHPTIEAPDVYNDPIGAQRVSPGGVETRKFRWESDAEFARRARQYGEARQAVETRTVRAQNYAKRAATADAAARRAWAALQAPTRAESIAGRLEGRAAASLDRLAGQLEDPSTGRVPAAWQPLWGSFQALRDEALADESGQLALHMAEIPENFAQVLQFAAEKGFDPTHIHDLTWDQAQRFLFGHLQLGMNDTESALRRTREGSLSRAGLADRSLAALGSGIIDATRELYRSKLVDWVERNYSQPFTRGAAIPDGWVAWDRTRDWILTGTDREGSRIAPNATRIIPKSVDGALRDMGKSYDNWAFHMVTKVTSPWRTLILSLSPSWYLKHAIGSIVLASADGVRLSDWRVAYRQWKNDVLPEDVQSIHSFAQSTQAPGVDVLIPRGPKSALTDEGLKAARHEVQRRIFILNNTINEISRGAVYEKMLRTGASREAALTRAYTALGDYGDMTPFERSAIRAVIPFYTFQKQMLKLVLRFPADHPMATALMLTLGNMHQEHMAELFGGHLPDAYFGLADLGSLGVRNLAAADPFRDASNLLTPEGIAGSMNPYLDIFARQAYNAPESFDTTKVGIGPTGKPQVQQNLDAALTGVLAGLPQARLAGQLTAGGDVYGNDPGTVGAISSFLGAPKVYDPTRVAQIAQNVRKATVAGQNDWYQSWEAPKGTPAESRPEAFFTKTPKVRKSRPARMPRVTGKVRKPSLRKTRLKRSHIKAIKRIV